MRTKKITTALAIVVVAFMSGVSNASLFTLTGSQHLDVATEYSVGSLFGFSTADVYKGGCVWNVYINDNATLQVLECRYGTHGLSVGRTRIKGNGLMIVSGGETGAITAEENSKITILGGSTGDILAFGTSRIDLFGGATPKIYVGDNSSLNVYAENIILGNGLWLDGNRLLGTGILLGQWFDGTYWTTQISSNAETATILLIPEPATLSLLALGGIWLAKRKR